MNMKERLKTLLIVSLLSFFLSSPLFSQEADDKEKEEAILVSKLEKTDGKKRLVILKELSELYWGVPKEEKWSEAYYNEAASQHNYQAEMDALLKLCRYCHNAEEEAEIQMWSHKADSIASVNNSFNNDYFDAKAFLTKHYIWAEKISLAADNAQSMYDKAYEIGNEYGLIVSGEVLGLTYQHVKKDSLAEKYLSEALARLMKQTNARPNFEAQLMTEVAETQLGMGHLKEAEKTIADFVSLVKDIEAGRTSISKGSAFPVNRCLRLAQVYYGILYTQRGELDAANKAFKKAKAIKESDYYVDYLLNLGLADYYLATKDYQAAITSVDSAISRDDSLSSTMKIRADIKAASGDFKGAMEDYRLSLSQKRKDDNLSISNMLSLQQSIHDLSNMALQLKDEKIRSDRIKLVSLFSLLLLFAAMLALGLFYLLRLRKLKGQVDQDNAKLIQSDNELREASERAEQSDRLKIAFLENINHEIRTPLNAIVGFSQVIADSVMESGDNDKKEISDIIRTNSDDLLRLLNGMLEISSLQSGTYQLSVSDCDARDCCLEALECIREKIVGSVTTEIEPGSDNFVLRTDKTLLMHALTNLLDNSVKYTKHGAIAVSYMSDTVNGKAYFGVRDTGTGISPENEAKMFDVFTKNDKFQQGLGLGLSECRIIAERLGGSISLDRSYVGGARFVISLPLKPLVELNKNRERL